MCDQDAVNAVIEKVCSQDRYRELFLKTLDYCRTPRNADDAEAFIASLPESRHSLQSPAMLMEMLENAGGLESAAIDAQGEIIADETCAQMTEDQLDEAIAGYRVSTTDAGFAVVGMLSPSKRLQAKLAEKPERSETYLKVLDLCRNPRTLADVQEFFRTDGSLARDTDVDTQPIAPDYYLSELEKTGALVWNEGWRTTAQGEAFLAAQSSVDGIEK